MKKKALILGLGLFTLGVFGTGIGVHTYDTYQEKADKAMTNNFVKDAGKLYDIDTQMLQAYQEPYNIMRTCSTANPSTCDFNKIGKSFNQSFSTLNILAGERIQITKKIALYKNQFQAWNP